MKPEKSKLFKEAMSEKPFAELVAMQNELLRRIDVLSNTKLFMSESAEDKEIRISMLNNFRDFHFICSEIMGEKLHSLLIVYGNYSG